MKVTIEYNGKKVDVELTAEQMKELGLQEKKKTGWERNEKEVYYHIATYMQLEEENDIKTSIDNRRYSAGNYFSDKTLAVKMLKRVRLMLKMQRWADEHNEPLDWNDEKSKYCIYYDMQLNKFQITCNTVTMRPSTIYFSSKEIAEAAIKEFGDDLIECYIESEVTR